MPTRPGKISVIVPLYYCSPVLYLPIDRFFSSLYESYPGIVPTVVDDASPLELPRHWPVTVRNEVNRGYTATVNRGLLLSGNGRDHAGDVMVVCNDDLVIQKGDLDRFHSFPPSPTIASPADTSSSDDDRFGACWGMNRAAYALLGPMDERLKHFYSDLEYYQRAKRLGVSIEKWPDVALEHAESSTYKLVDKPALWAEDRKEAERLGVV